MKRLGETSFDKKSKPTLGVTFDEYKDKHSDELYEASIGSTVEELASKENMSVDAYQYYHYAQAANKTALLAASNNQRLGIDTMESDEFLTAANVGKMMQEDRRVYTDGPDVYDAIVKNTLNEYAENGGLPILSQTEMTEKLCQKQKETQISQSVIAENESYTETRQPNISLDSPIGKMLQESQDDVSHVDVNKYHPSINFGGSIEKAMNGDMDRKAEEAENERTPV